MCKKSKKFISLILTVIMTLGVLPTFAFPAFAAEGDVCRIGDKYYGSLTEALDAVKDGETITMLLSVQYTDEIAINRINVTIDLNGYVLDVVRTEPGEASVSVGNGGSLSYTGEGAFNVTGVDCAVWVRNGGRLTVTNATATGEEGIAVLIDGVVVGNEANYAVQAADLGKASA